MTAHVAEESALSIARSDRRRAQDGVRRYKEQAYALVPASTQTLLDLGCGTGDDLLALAEHVRAARSFTGIDLRAELVDEARRRARNVALAVTFLTADAGALPFESGTFDVVRADFLLEELDDTGLVLSEALRVLRAGGLLLVHERAPSEQASRTLSRKLALAGFVELRTLEEFLLPDQTIGTTLVAAKRDAGTP